MSKHTEYITKLEESIPKGRVRTRFAPSPTGYMHVGNLRTALYAYLIAKKQGGDFLLRIEDTDQNRLVEGALDAIYNTLRECELLHDEGPDKGGPVAPYIQSQRREMYGILAEHLVHLGGAYRCFCEKGEDGEASGEEKTISKYDGRCGKLSEKQIEEKLAAKVPYVIRQRISPGKTSFSDVVYGEITVDHADLDQGVLLKSDGLPTYNFANVVDDHFMGISHVVRGSEYLSSTPKYNLLYESFGWEKPIYVHCSPVMRDANNKMSKRHGDPSYEDLIAQGFLMEAVVNYVALLGWSPGGEQEVFTREQLIENFDIAGISKSPAIFDIQKLRHFNSVYIRDMDAEKFHHIALPYMRQSMKNENYDSGKIALLLQKRTETLLEIPEKVDFFDKVADYETALFVNKKAKTDESVSKTMLEAGIGALQAVETFTHDNIHESLVALAESLEVKTATLMHPLRVALTGKSVSPGGALDLFEILGKEESITRLQAGLTKLA